MMLSVPDFDSLSPKFTAAMECLESFKTIQTARTSVVTAFDHVLAHFTPNSVGDVNQFCLLGIEKH